MKTNKLRNSFLVGLLTAGSIISGCGGGRKNTQPPVDPPVDPAAPIIAPIEDRVIDEGSTLVVDLNPYVSDVEGETVSIMATGLGSVENGIFTYNDLKDDDKDNDSHAITIRATNSQGKFAESVFNITQNDLRSHINPSFFHTGKWICYSPTNFNPNTDSSLDDQIIRDDLTVLYKANFKALVDYGASNALKKVPQLAKEVGFSKVVMGIWDIYSTQEWDNALAAKDYVDGYCLGNEGLLFNRYGKANLEQKMEDLRRTTGKPVSTSEPHNLYDDSLIENGDWVFPNVHPYWNGVTNPVQAANWTVDRLNELKASGTRLNRTVQIKEAGLPSGGEAGLSEQNQNDYYRTLETLITPSNQVPYFEGFDQTWKQEGNVGEKWGYFRSDRSTKKVSEVQIDFTSVSPINDTSGTASGKVWNANPSNYKVATYIKVGSNWWFKPYWDSLTSIGSSGSWNTDITTGGIDYTATQVYSAAVTNDFDPDNNSVSYPPQPSDNAKVIVGKFYTR